jgi:hypothetical protein
VNIKYFKLLSFRFLCCSSVVEHKIADIFLVAMAIGIPRFSVIWLFSTEPSKTNCQCVVNNTQKFVSHANKNWSFKANCYSENQGQILVEINDFGSRTFNYSLSFVYYSCGVLLQSSSYQLTYLWSTEYCISFH